jgi:hypothetical protein
MTVRKLPESKQYIPYPSAATHTMAIQTLAGVGKVFQRFLTPQRPAQDGHPLYRRVQLQLVVEALRMRAISDGFLDRVVASYGFEADCPARPRQ